MYFYFRIFVICLFFKPSLYQSFLMWSLLPVFSFWDFQSSLVSLLWILSQVDCLIPLPWWEKGQPTVVPTPVSTPQNYFHQCIRLHSEPRPATHPTPGHHRIPSITRSGPVLWSHCFFPGSWCAWDLCMPSKSRVSNSSSTVEFLWLKLAGLQSQILWRLFLPLPDPQDHLVRAVVLPVVMYGCESWTI